MNLSVSKDATSFISLETDRLTGVVTLSIDWGSRPVVSAAFCARFRAALPEIEAAIGGVVRTSGVAQPIFVVQSRWPGIFALGADFDTFPVSGAPQDNQAFDAYSADIIAGLLATYLGFNQPVLTIGIVDGPAFGAGVEMLLALDLVVATPRARFCLPEGVFGATPPIAPFLLSRRCEVTTIRRLIQEGVELSAEEARHAGLIDAIVDAPDPRSALSAYLETDATQLRAHRLRCAIEKRRFPLSRQDLEFAMAGFRDLLNDLSEADKFRVRLLLEKQLQLSRQAQS